MSALFSLFGFILFFGLGAFAIYLLIDFIEYLRKFHSRRWEELSFANLFGISQKDVFFYQIHPMKFFPYIFNKEDDNDANVAGYKKRIQLAIGGFSALFVINILMSLIGI